jgi:hypothetical protein
MPLQRRNAWNDVRTSVAITRTVNAKDNVQQDEKVSDIFATQVVPAVVDLYLVCL